MQITANFDVILRNATFCQFFVFFMGLKWFLISDWQIYKIAGSHLLEAF